MALEVAFLLFHISALTFSLSQNVRMVARLACIERVRFFMEDI